LGLLLRLNSRLKFLGKKGLSMASGSLPRFLVSSLICVTGFSGIGITSALAAVQDRLTTPVANTSYVAIPNTIHPRAKLGTDLGPAPSSTPLPGMSIRFNMTDAQAAALDQLLADQQNPSSPRFHQWLTPTQYAAQFGMSSNDLGTVSAWLSSQGFKVTGVANGGTFITFDGTVAQAQTAFLTSIHNISINGETHFANVTNVSVPRAFAGAVASITGLHNFRLEPRARTSIVKPDFTSSISGDHYIAPGDIYTIYNVNPLLSAGINGSGLGTGANCHSVAFPAGSTAPPCGDIAVTGQVDIYTADVSAFRSASGLSTSNLPTTVYAGANPGYPVCNSCTTGANQGDLEESSIDVEWSGAMAPSATIDFVTGVDVLANSVTYAIDSDVAPIVTTSYGLCEAGWGSAELLDYNSLFKQANAQGQTVLAAAADEGATDCDAGPSAIEGLAVDFPGSSPYVTSTGGTQFNDGTATGATTYWSSTNGTTGGSATSYIPESPWNDEPGFDSFGGGGGGASAFFTKPAWQIGTGVPADSARDVPDIALDASDAHDPLIYCVNVALGDSCTTGYRLANNDLNVAGGTSFDSQIFGGLLALIEQNNGLKGLGNINPMIYALANDAAFYTPGQNTSTLSSVVFNDVNSGNNDMPCTAGSPNCLNGGQVGYSAGNGYDLTSGWGSPNVYNLAKAWGTIPALGIGSLGTNISATTLTTTPACTTTVSGGPCSVTATEGATITLTATVSGTSTITPTGTVQFLANNVALGSAVAVTASSSNTATATYSWVTACSALGQQVVSASYSGDVNYQGSIGPLLTVSGGATTSNGSTQTSPVEVQITGSTCPTYTVSTTTPSVTVASGGTIPGVTITVTPSNGFTGTVTFSATATNTSGYAPTLTFSPASVTISSTAAQSTTLSLSGITANLRIPNAPGQVDSPIRMAQHNLGRGPWYEAGSGVTILSLLLLVLPPRRRLSSLLVMALAVALIGGATGCGSSQTGPPTTTTTTTTGTSVYIGTYVVTVSAAYTSSSNQVTQQVTTVTYAIN
jgi:hypothetical protein